MLRGNAVATIIAAPEPEPALVRELEAWWPTIPDAVALTGLQTYRQDVVREAALTHAETAEMGRILEAAACRAVVLNTLHWGADVALAEAAGLKWINSNADKIPPVQQAMAHEPKPVHVPRDPKPPVQVDEGPLVLDETRKDLAQIKLPFETGPASAPPA